MAKNLNLSLYQTKLNLSTYRVLIWFFSHGYILDETSLVAILNISNFQSNSLLWMQNVFQSLFQLENESFILNLPPAPKILIDNESLSDTSSFYKKSRSTRSNSFQLSHTPNSLRLSGSENFENDHGATSVTLSMPLCPSQKLFRSTSNLLSQSSLGCPEFICLF